MNYLTYLLFLFISSAFAQFHIYLDGDENNNINSTDIRRYSDMSSINIPNIASALYYHSLGIQDGGNGTAAEKSVDGCFGAAFPSIDGPFVSFLTYFNVSAEWTGAARPDSADVSKAAVMVGSAYLGLIEVDSNNETLVLSQVLMQDLRWNVTQVQSLGNVKYATFYGSDSNNADFSISFTFVITNNSETLSTGVQLDPKGVEAIINILNYNFTSNTSNLILTVGVATATAGDAKQLEEEDGMQQIMAGDDSTGVYWAGGNSVIIDADGTIHDIKINSIVANDADMRGASFVGQCHSMQRAHPHINVNFTLINITFPQSNNLTYDPALGIDVNGSIGKDDDDDHQGNAAYTLQPQSTILFFTLLLVGAAIKFL